MVASLAVIALTIMPVVAQAQVRYDRTQGVYWVTLRPDSGPPVELRVVPTNRVEGRAITRTARESNGRIRYEYRFFVDRGSPQALAFARIPCPAASGPSEMWAGRLGHQSSLFAIQWRGYFDSECKLTIYAGPGDSGSGGFASSWLPGVGGIVLRGAIGAVLWPTGDPDDATERLRPTVDSLQGNTPNGLVYTVLGVVPLYDPIILAAHPDSAFRALAVSLRKICHDTDWIRSEEQCRDLTADLHAVGEAIGLGEDADGYEGHGDRHPFAAPSAEHRSSATRRLTGFLHDLDAARGHQVTESAYGVLSILGSTLLHSLGGS